MAFGPMDRFDVIELKGLDEHERQREGNGGLRLPPFHVLVLTPLIVGRHRGMHRSVMFTLQIAERPGKCIWRFEWL